MIQNANVSYQVSSWHLWLMHSLPVEIRIKSRWQMESNWIERLTSESLFVDGCLHESCRKMLLASSLRPSVFCVISADPDIQLCPLQARGVWWQSVPSVGRGNWLDDDPSVQHSNLRRCSYCPLQGAWSYSQTGQHVCSYFVCYASSLNYMCPVVILSVVMLLDTPYSVKNY